MWSRRIEPAIGRRLVRDVTGDECSMIVHSPFRVERNWDKSPAGRARPAIFTDCCTTYSRRRFAGSCGPSRLAIRSTRSASLASGVGSACCPTTRWAFLTALDDAERDGAEAPQIIGAARAVVLTGFRIRELLTLRREYIRDDLGEVRLPDTKSGFSARPVAPEFLEFVSRLPKRPGVRGCFPRSRTRSAH